MTTTMNPETAEQMIAQAAPYTEFLLTTKKGDIRLMARDWPRAGRRCTCLTFGTEWFDIDAASLQRMDFQSLTVISEEAV